MCLRELTKQSSELAHQRVLNAEGAANAQAAKAVVPASQVDEGSVATSQAEGGSVADPAHAPQPAAGEAVEVAAEGKAEEAACEAVSK